MEEILNSAKFNAFIADNRARTLAYLKSRFTSLASDDIEDVYQDASVALYENIQNGQLTELTSTLYTYFLRICINKANKVAMKKEHRKTVGISDEGETFNDCVSQKHVERVLMATSENEDESVTDKKQHLVCSILDAMTSKCKSLLWSFYVEDLSWAVIAGQNGLANANTAKSSANRCRNSFRDKYNELIGKIYGETE